MSTTGKNGFLFFLYEELGKNIHYTENRFQKKPARNRVSPEEDEVNLNFIGMQYQKLIPEKENPLLVERKLAQRKTADLYMSRE